MRLANHTSAALISSLFLRPNNICLPSSYSYTTNNTTNNTSMTAPVISVCHGGGPMPLLNDPGHKNLIKSMSQRVPAILGLGTRTAPRAIVLVTAHWSEDRPTISSAHKHKLYYDYGGFPPETYRLKYDAPGSPGVAGEIYELLERAGMRPEMDSERGWDHGVFVPMTLINPTADIPVVQLSVLASNSPAQHFAMGQALSSLRSSNVAILGSGMPSFHNLRMWRSGGVHDGAVQKRNAEWNRKLTETLKIEDSGERARMLEGWREWVGAEEAHPEGGVEHFLPLIVCAGAAGNAKAEGFADDVMDTTQYTYYWT